jgi:glycosyltransferase involved in cell wall biosynthesis
MNRLRVHLLYEYGEDYLSHCSGHIRLMRPFEHPSVRDRVEVTHAQFFDGHACDVVIFERLTHAGVTMAEIDALLPRIRDAGGRLIYAQDDNMLDLREGLPGQQWLTDEHIAVMERVQREATGILVTTPALRDRLASYNDNIVVVPNALDERLVVGPPRAKRRDGKIVVGYMGTRSHDEDLDMIGQALLSAQRELGDRLQIEIVGVLGRNGGRGLPIRELTPPPGNSDYPFFLSWFSANVRWDVGLAPLRKTAYTACKSDIKLLDYSAIGAAGIFTRFDPYASVLHGETGYLVDNDPADWEHGLLELLTNDALRERIADGARRYLFAERTLKHRAKDWVFALEQLLAATAVKAA